MREWSGNEPAKTIRLVDIEANSLTKIDHLGNRM